MSGISVIGAERIRQMEKWTDEHDDQHDYGELAMAAACYAIHAGTGAAGNWRRADGGRSTPRDWPWEAEAWKPSEDPVRDLAKAGALVAAEIERLERART